MSDSINIEGLDKAAVLAALFNAAAPQGFGFLQSGFGPQSMTVEDAQRMIDEQGASFDYVHGRPLKIELNGDTIDPWGFDRDNGGPGSAQKVIDRLRQSGEANSPESDEARESLTHIKAHQAMNMANEPTMVSGGHVHLGGADLGYELERAVDTELERLKR